MRIASVVASLSSELTYMILMIATWIMLLGWSAALISACVLAFRNRAEEDEDERSSLAMEIPASPRRLDRSPTLTGFGL